VASSSSTADFHSRPSEDRGNASGQARVALDASHADQPTGQERPGGPSFRVVRGHLVATVTVNRAAASATGRHFARAPWKCVKTNGR
jgi:hypothetical protein